MHQLQSHCFQHANRSLDLLTPFWSGNFIVYLACLQQDLPYTRSQFAAGDLDITNQLEAAVWSLHGDEVANQAMSQRQSGYHHSRPLQPLLIGQNQVTWEARKRQRLPQQQQRLPQQQQHQPHSNSSSSHNCFSSYSNSCFSSYSNSCFSSNGCCSSKSKSCFNYAR